MKNHNELVSIIIPLYNAEKYIEETVKSALNQTFQDTLIYIIDDHSTDKSPEIAKKLVEEYPDKITYLRSPQKGGRPSATKNVGIDVAKGKYLAFLDNDDWWDPQKIEKQVDYLDKHPNVVMVGTNVAVVDTDQNKTLGNFWSDPSSISAKRMREIVLEGPLYASTTCIMARSDYMQKHHFDTHYIGADEYDLSLHAVLDDSNQVALIPEVLAYWRWHQASLSHSAQAAVKGAEDEEYFADKLLRRGDLSSSEVNIVMQRLWMVRRRAANSLLINGKRQEARIAYLEVLKNSQSKEILTRIILFIDILFPALARYIVKSKKRFSYAKPAFR